jgi:hypothetical protein
MPERADELAALLHELSLHDDASELRHFAELCRRSLRVRTWLFGRFAQEPETQQKFRAFLRDPSVPPDGLWSPVLEKEVASRPPSSSAVVGEFGGLSESGIWALIKLYQAGRIDVMTFLLVRVWLQIAAAKRSAPPALWRATLEHWAVIVGDAEGRLVRDLAKAIAFFQERPAGLAGGVDAESADSWKIYLLLYILDHPQPSYRVGDLLEKLPAKFRRKRRNGNPWLDRREIRLFCEKHGIRRDRRAGKRPQSNSKSFSAQRSPRKR